MRLLILLSLAVACRGQATRRVGKLQEVFAWKQVTFNIDGNMVLQDQDRFFGPSELGNTRDKRQSDNVFFNRRPDPNWNQNFPNGNDFDNNEQPGRVPWTSRPPATTARPNVSDDASRFFIQYNNLPMGVERVGKRIFVTIPRRRYGIPSTLNYLDLEQDSNDRSPGLRPYPDLRRARSLVSVYRTRADACGRLWMVDNGLLEIPNNPQQLQQPAIVVFDLSTDQQILRYPLKNTDIISANTPAGLASITIDMVNGDCSNIFAYIPDLATYGLIVYSLRDNDSWRLTHNYFSFLPTAGDLRISGQRFTWSDGIFSITLTEPGPDSCRTAYFHAMVSTNEFSVSTCTLRNRTAIQDSDFWTRFSFVGDRGANSQCTMHGYHAGSSAVFFADIGRDAISCWHTSSPLTPSSVEILATDGVRLSYPSDLHVTGDELWTMANNLPTWAYGRLNTNDYNFYIYRANIQDLISGTVCGRSVVA